MGSVTRRTLSAVLVAAPALAAAVALPGAAATAFPNAAQQAGETKVSAGDLKFTPPEVTVAAGSKVTWTNTDGIPHTVTGGNGTEDPASPMKGDVAARGATYSVTFTAPGTYPYYCKPHVGAGMKGTITVTAGGAATPTATATVSAPAASSAPPASATASATVGAPQQGAGAPTEEPHEEGEEGHDEIPGVKGNKTLESIEAERAAQSGAVSGFRFFAAVATAFLFILGAAVLFSTRPRRAGR